MESRLFVKLYRLFSTQFLKLLAMLLWLRRFLNLMKDQVDKLANLGILAASLNDISEENARGVRAEMFK